MRFPPAFLDEIRDRVPISAVVGSRVSWDKRKTNSSRGDYWACCPFHGEKSPSFHCEDRKGRYHCFGCGVSGDHFRFLTELDGMSFPEAVERVADMAGIAMPQPDPEMEKRERHRASLHDVMEMATQFFQEKLQSSDGAKARAYLRERGLTPATQQAFRLGFIPEGRNALKEFLASKGVEKEQIEACGLVRHGPDIAVSYDWFRDRIMFPIPDSRGRIIAFGGRAMAQDALAKYMNSPDTELFHKGQVLYNFARARTAAQKVGTLIAVEGYMDVIALAQAGFEHAVAPLGTALTEDQLGLLWRVTSEPILCFDGDQAGQRAAWRAADLALPMVAAGKTVRFAMLPDGKDPDDLVRDGGPSAFQDVLADARPLADILWMRETQTATFDTPEKRAALEGRLREITSKIRDEDVRRHYQQEMQNRARDFFGASQRQGQYKARGQGGFQRGEGYRRSGGAAAPGRLAVSERLSRSTIVSRSSGMSVREAVITVSLINHPRLIDMDFDRAERLDLADADLKRLHGCVIDALAHGVAFEREPLIEAIVNAGLDDVLQKAILLVRRARLWFALEDAAFEDAKTGFEQALSLHLSRRTLHKELKAAEMALVSDYTEENYLHMLEIQSQIRETEATEALIEGFGLLSGRVGK
ncbi:DNA primase [Limoniibacter endophyticus]|uniref:DNA primase n=1 Tax=Limoniibacter endophyticus TaxID=1565040 RepID=A0A8J3GHG2_9HYPH|nr:DNA primase [Limoniibacter endophyticus]GHC66028.1 DNA primase [Limoniibacter endophyticus]